jgi:hypothetical protein
MVDRCSGVNAVGGGRIEEEDEDVKYRCCWFGHLAMATAARSLLHDDQDDDTAMRFNLAWTVVVLNAMAFHEVIVAANRSVMVLVCLVLGAVCSEPLSSPNPPTFPTDSR